MVVLSLKKDYQYVVSGLIYFRPSQSPPYSLQTQFVFEVNSVVTKVFDYVRILRSHLKVTVPVPSIIRVNIRRYQFDIDLIGQVKVHGVKFFGNSLISHRSSSTKLIRPLVQCTFYQFLDPYAPDVFSAHPSPSTEGF